MGATVITKDRQRERPEVPHLRDGAQLGVRPRFHPPALETTRDPRKMTKAGSGEALEHARLRERVEAFDVGQAARLASGDETHRHPQQERQSHWLGDEPPGRGETRDRRLVVDLPEPRQPQALPSEQLVATEALGALVPKLRGRGAATGDIDGVEGEEARRPRARAQVAEPDDVGPVPARRARGAGYPEGAAGRGTRTAGAVLPARAGIRSIVRRACSGRRRESSSSRAMASAPMPAKRPRATTLAQAGAYSEHRAHDPLGRRPRAVLGGPRALAQAVLRVGREASAPLARPLPGAAAHAANLADRDAASQQLDGFATPSLLVHVGLLTA